MGTIGSGNHFIEVQRVDEVFDAATAAAFGLREEQVTVLIHSGSRGLGHQVCTDYVRTMDDAQRRDGTSCPTGSSPARRSPPRRAVPSRSGIGTGTDSTCGELPTRAAPYFAASAIGELPDGAGGRGRDDCPRTHSRGRWLVATGTVKWFSDAKGYGSITPDEGGPDLFIHFTGITDGGFRTLPEGSRVEFEVRKGRKGMEAFNVVPVGGPAQPVSPGRKEVP